MCGAGHGPDGVDLGSGPGEEVSPAASFSALLEDDVNDLYENAPCDYLSALLDGRIAKANTTLLNRLGYGRQEMVGRLRFTDLLTVGGKLYHETHFARGTARSSSAFSPPGTTGSTSPWPVEATRRHWSCAPTAPPVTWPRREASSSEPCPTRASPPPPPLCGPSIRCCSTWTASPKPAPARKGSATATRTPRLHRRAQHDTRNGGRNRSGRRLHPHRPRAARRRSRPDPLPAPRPLARPGHRARSRPRCDACDACDACHAGRRPPPRLSQGAPSCASRQASRRSGPCLTGGFPLPGIQCSRSGPSDRSVRDAKRMLRPRRE